MTPFEHPSVLSSYAITCEGIVIGHSAFEAKGSPRGVLRGRFEPTPEFEHVRPLFKVDALWHELVEDVGGERLVSIAERVRSTLAFEILGQRGERFTAAHVYVSDPPEPGAPREVIAFIFAPPPRPRSGSAPRVPVARPTLTAEWMGHDGAVAETLEPPGIDARLHELARAGSPCLRFIDPDGSTVFNRRQIPVLTRELRDAHAIAPAALRPRVEQLLRFLDRPADSAHTHVRFGMRRG